MRKFASRGRPKEVLDENVVVKPINSLRINDDEIINSEIIDYFTELVKRTSVIPPVLVDPTDHVIAGSVKVVVGKLLKFSLIPTIVKDISNSERIIYQKIETRSHNLDPITEAELYRELLDNFNLTQEELCVYAKMSRQHITNYIRLLTLPDCIQDLVRRRELPYSYARNLPSLPNLSEIVKNIMENGLLVKDIENLIIANRKNS